MIKIDKILAILLILSVIVGIWKWQKLFKPLENVGGALQADKR